MARKSIRASSQSLGASRNDTHGADQDQAEKNRDGWRNQSEAHGVEERGRGTNGRSTLSFKSGSTSAGMKHEVKHPRK